MQLTDVDSRLKKLTEAVRASGRKLSQEIAAAINSTAKKTRGVISKEIRNELVAKKKDIDRYIGISRRASKEKLVGGVKLDKSRRIPLRDFGARQTKKGTTYRTSKTRGRKLAAGAFQGPRPGLMKASWKGRVFKRVGKTRLPIQQLYGPSPWGVFVKGKMVAPTSAATRIELIKQMDRRIKFNVLKATGEI
jgi:hypothetical protein